MGNIGSTGTGQNQPSFCPTPNDFLKARENLKSHDKSAEYLPDVKPKLPAGDQALSKAGDTKLSERTAGAVTETALPSLKSETPDILREKKAAALKKADVALGKLKQTELMDIAQKILKGESVEGENYGNIIISIIVPPSTDPITVHPPDKSVPKETMDQYRATASNAFDKFKADPENADFDREKLDNEVAEIKGELTRIGNELIVQGEEEDAEWESEFNALRDRDPSFHITDDEDHQVITSIPRTPSSPARAVADDIEDVAGAVDPAEELQSAPSPEPPPPPPLLRSENNPPEKGDK